MRLLAKGKMYGGIVFTSTLTSIHLWHFTNYINFILSYCICSNNWRGFCNVTIDVESWVISTPTCCLILKVIQWVRTKPLPFIFCIDAAYGWTCSLLPLQKWHTPIVWSWFSSSSARARNRGPFGEMLASLGNGLGSLSKMESWC